MHLATSLPDNGHDPCWGIEADSWADQEQVGSSWQIAIQDSSIDVHAANAASHSSYQVCFFLVLTAAFPVQL